MVKKLAGFDFYSKLLKNIKRQVREVQGPEPDTLKRYYRNYARTLEKSRALPSSLDEVVSSISASSLGIVGDFHTLDQSQRQCVEILDELRERKTHPVLALEMVLASHDRHIRELLSGQIDESQFLERIGYFEHWGFDPCHYRPLWHWAREHRAKVHGINREGPLGKRDAFMAQRLLHLLRLYPGHPVVALVGDVHLAPSHLPKQIKKHGRDVVILFQNSETVIMRRLRSGNNPFGWYKLGSGRFLVNNTPPWVKMQTYLSWLEHGGEALCAMQGFCLSRNDTGDTPDLTETVYAYTRMLKDLFQLYLRPDDTFQVYTMTDLGFLDQPYFRRRPGNVYARIIREGRSLFIPHGNVIYIPLLDLNRTVEESLHYLMGTALDVSPEPKSFFSRIHYYASGFAASKLINPTRAARTRQAMQATMEEIHFVRRKKEREYLQFLLGIYKSTLDFLQITDNGKTVSELPRLQLQRFLEKDSETHFALSQQIGYQVGEALYGAYNAGELSGVDLKHYIFSQGDPFTFVPGLIGRQAS